MNYEYIFWILVFLLDIGAIISILNEEILFSNKEKFIRTLIVIIIPIIGALFEIRRAKKEAGHIKQNNEGIDTITGGGILFSDTSGDYDYDSGSGDI